MAKDPAFLFYPGDWMGGTATFTRFLKGAYMDVLMAQFNSGALSLEEIKTVLGSDFGQSWPTIQKKFKQTEDGLFLNERLQLEKEKRIEYTQSRAGNRSGKTKKHMKNISKTYEKHMIQHMENENTNEIKSKNQIELEKKKKKFIIDVDEFKNHFSDELLSEFKSYWLEPNRSKTKFRFEAQPFFDFKKRLNTFLNNEKKYTQSKASENKVETLINIGKRLNEKLGINNAE